jgi:hypothetical protein
LPQTRFTELEARGDLGQRIAAFQRIGHPVRKRFVLGFIAFQIGDERADFLDREQQLVAGVIAFDDRPVISRIQRDELFDGNARQVGGKRDIDARRFWTVWK